MNSESSPETRANPSEYPRGCACPRWPFVGRSNVGKSSVINTLVGRKQPGPDELDARQDAAHPLLHGGRAGFMYLVDLPGFGYGRGSAGSERAAWQSDGGVLPARYAGAAAGCLDPADGPAARAREATRSAACSNGCRRRSRSKSRVSAGPRADKLKPQKAQQAGVRASGIRRLRTGAKEQLGARVESARA